ncbi:MAG: SpoIVB peptidase S55 domain-containing protein [Acidobacteriota bacterium]
MKQITTAFFSVLLLGAFALAQSDSKLFPLEDIRPGMKGYGMSVFQGTKPERFEVEILGLAEGLVNPKQSIIIARLSGQLAERSFVFAGMSGSPVYIDGKLVGAVAYSFPFAKEPIAGIQPIKYMIEIFEQGGAEEPRTNQRISFNTLMAQSINQKLPAQPTMQLGPRAARSSALIPYIGQIIQPIATPVTFSGVPQAVLDMFAEDLRQAGIQAIAGGGSGSSLSPMAAYDENTLTPGSSVSAQLVRGDFTIDAAGTVTHRDGDRVYAFGHPFLTSGQTSWPMAEDRVITVVPNLNNSFKLSVAGNMVGSINQDRSTGIYGKLGERPRLIPVRLTVRTSRNKTETYNFEVVKDSLLTPVLVRIAMAAGILATERQIGSQTLSLSGRIKINGQADVILDNSFSSPAGVAAFTVNAVAQPIAVLLNSGFDAVDIGSIEVNVTSTDTRSTGVLSRVWVDKTEARRGETIELQVFARNDNGSEYVERIPVEIPADAPTGPLAIVVGDGASVNQTELRAQAATEFLPKDLGQLVRAINRLKKNNRLYVKVIKQTTGAIVNNEEMPALPPSVLLTLGSQRTSGGYTPLSVATLAERELPPSKFLIVGQEAITINVVK